MKSTEEFLRRAFLPAQLALKYHPFYRGKIEIVPKCPIRSFDDFAIWYTHGVAEACETIRNRPEAVFENTNKWNSCGAEGDRAGGCEDQSNQGRVVCERAINNQARTGTSKIPYEKRIHSRVPDLGVRSYG